MQKSKLKIGIIGCGAMGTQIARACQERIKLKDKIELAAICDIDETKAGILNKGLRKKALVLNLNEIIEKTDLVVEASSASVSADVVKRCIEKTRDCLVMSVGGLLGKERLLDLARARGVT